MRILKPNIDVLTLKNLSIKNKIDLIEENCKIYFSSKYVCSQFLANEAFSIIKFVHNYERTYITDSGRIKLKDIINILSKSECDYNFFRIHSNKEKYRIIIGLEDYEELCPECKGLSKLYLYNNQYESYVIRCYKCNCKGKLDWIDSIRSKNEK